MIARAAEDNPSIFLPTGPVPTVEELIPSTFLPVCIATDNHYSSTKFLLYQHSPSPHPISKLTKAEKKKVQDGVSAAKTYEDVVKVFGCTVEDCRKRGRRFLRQLKANLRERDPSAYPEDAVAESWEQEEEEDLTTDSKDVDSGPVGPHADEVHRNVWQERTKAEKSGNVRDGPSNDEVLAKEVEDDEEALMNG